MRFRRTLIASSLLTVWAASVAGAAAPRLETPRPTENGRAFRTVQPGPTLAPLGIGNPNSFAMGDAWITSDLLPDDFSTDLLWFDDETLTIVGGFYTTRTTNVTLSVQVKNQSGTIVFADSFSAPPFAGEINYASLDIGLLQSGIGGGAAGYKVILKFKQGIKVIGQQFWIPVFPGAARPSPG